MADYIKRESVINAVESLPTWWADDGGFYGGAKPPMVALLDPEDTISAIENIPSEDVAEVKHGKWIRPTRVPDSILSECSICGFDTGAFTFNYCPNCGADMRKDGE